MFSIRIYEITSFIKWAKVYGEKDSDKNLSQKIF